MEEHNIINCLLWFHNFIGSTNFTTGFKPEFTIQLKNIINSIKEVFHFLPFFNNSILSFINKFKNDIDIQQKDFESINEAVLWIENMNRHEPSTDIVEWSNNLLSETIDCEETKTFLNQIIEFYTLYPMIPHNFTKDNFIQSIKNYNTNQQGFKTILSNYLMEKESPHSQFLKIKKYCSDIRILTSEIPHDIFLMLDEFEVAKIIFENYITQYEAKKEYIQIYKLWKSPSLIEHVNKNYLIAFKLIKHIENELGKKKQNSIFDSFFQDNFTFLLYLETTKAEVRKNQQNHQKRCQIIEKTESILNLVNQYFSKDVLFFIIPYLLL